MPRVLGVSASGYHARQQRKPSARAQADATLLKQVRTIHASSRKTYGPPRIHAALRVRDQRHGRTPIARLLTFVLTTAGFLYLAVVLDAGSRKIVGWSMANHLRAELVLDALERPMGLRKPPNVIHHSDQGSQGGFNWSSQQPQKGSCDANSKAAIRSVGQAPLRSPGRPAVARRDEQRRFWTAIAAGMASEDAAIGVGVP